MGRNLQKPWQIQTPVHDVLPQGTINTCDIKPETCKEYRVVSGTATEVDGPARTDLPALDKRDKCFRGGLTVPGDLIKRHVTVNPVDIGIVHTDHFLE